MLSKVMLTKDCRWLEQWNSVFRAVWWSEDLEVFRCLQRLESNKAKFVDATLDSSTAEREQAGQQSSELRRAMARLQWSRRRLIARRRDDANSGEDGNWLSRARMSESFFPGSSAERGARAFFLPPSVDIRTGLREGRTEAQEICCFIRLGVRNRLTCSGQATTGTVQALTRALR